MKKNKDQIIYGRNPIKDALEAGQHFEKIYLKSGLKGDFVQELYSFSRERNIPIKKVPLIKLDKLSRQKNHQGVLGMISAVEYQSIQNVVPFIFERGENPLILILEGITDVRNLGAISRSAEVLGVHSIVLPMVNSAEVNEDAIKTSAGALLSMSICREYDLSGVVDYLKESGFHIISSSLDADDPIFEIDMTVPLCIVLGSEQKGVSKELLNKSNHIFKIPQLGKTDSLNVSVATGITLYECMRQRKLIS